MHTGKPRVCTCVRVRGGSAVAPNAVLCDNKGAPNVPGPLTEQAFISQAGTKSRRGVIDGSGASSTEADTLRAAQASASARRGSARPPHLAPTPARHRPPPPWSCAGSRCGCISPPAWLPSAGTAAGASCAGRLAQCAAGRRLPQTLRARPSATAHGEAGVVAEGGRQRRAQMSEATPSRPCRLASTPRRSTSTVASTEACVTASSVTSTAISMPRWYCTGAWRGHNQHDAASARGCVHACVSADIVAARGGRSCG